MSTRVRPPSGQNGGMSRPPGDGGEFARGASAAVAKGAALIGLAVIVGVFLLQRVDTSTAGSHDDAGEEADEDDHVHAATAHDVDDHVDHATRGPGQDARPTARSSC